MGEKVTEKVPHREMACTNEYCQRYPKKKKKKMTLGRNKSRK